MGVRAGSKGNNDNLRYRRSLAAAAVRESTKRAAKKEYFIEKPNLHAQSYRFRLF